MAKPYATLRAEMPAENRRRAARRGKAILAQLRREERLTQAELAKHLGCDVKVVNRIVNGRSAVTAEMAIRLGAAFRMSPEFWLNAQQAVDIYEATKRVKKVPEPIPMAV